MSNEFLQSSPSNSYLDSILYNNNTTNTSNQQDSLHLGWTPVIQRNMNNEVLIYSSPKFNLDPAGSGNNILANDFDYSNLNISLTPLINNANSHYLSLTSNPLNSNTPFNDKSLQLNDFFMDSPIKDTPLMNKILRSKTKTPLKRSINQLDDSPSLSSLRSPLRGLKEYKDFQTPSKRILRDITNSPKKIKLLKIGRDEEDDEEEDEISDKNDQDNEEADDCSSPSTIIMSSAVKSVRKETSRETATNIEPPSPTPLKELKVDADNKPMMGIFKGKKVKSPPKMSSGLNKFQIVFHDVKGKKKKKMARSQTTFIPKNTTNNNNNIVNEPTNSLTYDKKFERSKTLPMVNNMNFNNNNVNIDYQNYVMWQLQQQQQQQHHHQGIPNVSPPTQFPTQNVNMSMNMNWNYAMNSPMGVPSFSPMFNNSPSFMNSPQFFNSYNGGVTESPSNSTKRNKKY